MRIIAFIPLFFWATINTVFAEESATKAYDTSERLKSPLEQRLQPLSDSPLQKSSQVRQSEQDSSKPIVGELFSASRPYTPPGPTSEENNE